MEADLRKLPHTSANFAVSRFFSSSEVERMASAHASVEDSREDGEMQEQFSQSNNPAERLLQTRRRILPEQLATHGCCEQYQ